MPVLSEPRLRRLSLPLLTAALLVGSASQLQAQEDPALQLVKDALVEFEGGHWIEAYNFFKKAHATSPSARTLRGMGMTSYEMGEYARALEELNAARASSDRPLTPAQIEQVDGLIRRSSLLVGTLEIAVSPETAAVLVNGERTDKRKVVLPVGRVTVRAKQQGYTAEQEVVNVEGGQSYTVHLTLNPLASTPLESAPVATTPETTEPQEPGSSDLVAEGPSDDSDSLIASPWLWVGVGLAVVGGVVATIVLAGGDGDDGEVESLPESNVGTNWTVVRRW